MVLGITALIKDLAQLMNKEIELIETRRMKEHAELLKKKQRMTIDYRASLKAIVMQPEILRQVPENVRQGARIAAHTLAEASERNAKILRTAILASQRLVQTIVSLVKSEVLPKPCYTNPNAVRLVPGAYSPTCKPVAVRRTA